MKKQAIERTPPLTNKQKELLFGIKIEELTPAEILERYGDALTEEQKKILKLPK